MEGQRDLPDEGIQIPCIYSPKELREFLEVYQQKSGEGILAWILQALDSGTVSFHLLLCEKDLLSPMITEHQIQWGCDQLQNIRGPDGQDTAAPTLYKVGFSSFNSICRCCRISAVPRKLVYDGRRY